MKPINITPALVIAFLLAVVLLPIQAQSFDFRVTEQFCEIHFNGQIAKKGEPFNETDFLKKRLPRRRIVDEFVTSDVAFIWYEHGGIAPHQHLVQYDMSNPKVIINNYTFGEPDHKRIVDLIRDKDFLKNLVSEKDLL